MKIQAGFTTLEAIVVAILVIIMIAVMLSIRYL